jgi:hypothetical protein
MIVDASSSKRPSGTLSNDRLLNSLSNHIEEFDSIQSLNSKLITNCIQLLLNFILKPDNSIFKFV